MKDVIFHCWRQKWKKLRSRQRVGHDFVMLSVIVCGMEFRKGCFLQRAACPRPGWMSAPNASWRCTVSGHNMMGCKLPMWIYLLYSASQQREMACFFPKACTLRFGLWAEGKSGAVAVTAPACLGSAGWGQRGVRLGRCRSRVEVGRAGRPQGLLPPGPPLPPKSL